MSRDSIHSLEHIFKGETIIFNEVASKIETGSVRKEDQSLGDGESQAVHNSSPQSHPEKKKQLLSYRLNQCE